MHLVECNSTFGGTLLRSSGDMAAGLQGRAELHRSSPCPLQPMVSDVRSRCLGDVSSPQHWCECAYCDVDLRTSKLNPVHLKLSPSVRPRFPGFSFFSASLCRAFQAFPSLPPAMGLSPSAQTSLVRRSRGYTASPLRVSVANTASDPGQRH